MRVAITAMQGRHPIVQLALHQLACSGWEVCCAGSEGEASRRVVAPYGHYVEVPNEPLGAKFNAALALALREYPDLDAVLIVGSDNLIATPLLDTMAEIDADVAGLLDAYEYHPDTYQVCHWPGYCDEISKRDGNPLRTNEPVGSCKLVSRRMIDPMDGKLWPPDGNRSLDWHMMRRINPFVQTVTVAQSLDWGGIQIGWRDPEALNPNAFRNSRDERLTWHEAEELLGEHFSPLVVERAMVISRAINGDPDTRTTRHWFGVLQRERYPDGSPPVDITIGENTEIHPTAVIGQDGFGLVDEPPLRIPHVGNVVIGDDCWIRAFVTIDRGTVDDTVIGNHVMIDHHVHIAHNCQIGDNVKIVAHSNVEGSVTIEDGAYITGSVVIRPHVTIGAGAFIGAGSVVVCDVPPGERWWGVPARKDGGK